MVFTDQRNKDDAHWEMAYNIPGFVSLATGGDGHVVVYQAQAIPRPLLAHEMGHDLATVIYGSTRYRPSSDYAAAVAAGEPPVSLYGAVDPAEDFAEAVRLYVEDPQQLKARAPKKSRVIDRLTNEVGYGG